MNGWESVFWQLFQYLILPIGSTVVVILVAWLARKLSANLTTAQQAAVHEFLTRIVSQGVAYAEQVAKQKAQENEEINGAQKRYLAIEFTFKELEKYGIINIASDQVSDLIEAVLGKATLDDNQLLGNILPTIEDMGKEQEDPGF